MRCSVTLMVSDGERGRVSEGWHGMASVGMARQVYLLAGGNRSDNWALGNVFFHLELISGPIAGWVWPLVEFGILFEKN